MYQQKLTDQLSKITADLRFAVHTKSVRPFFALRLGFATIRSPNVKSKIDGHGSTVLPANIEENEVTDRKTL